MNLIDNPIFLTQKRLVHRGGVLAAILIAALVGLSLLSGIVAYRANPANFPDFRAPQEAGKMFYGWTIGVELLVLVFGGFSRISRTLAEERKAGLWDSNRLTPLSSSQLVSGYWFGASLREFYMALVLAGTGLLVVLLANLSPTVWFGTQILIFSTALFFGLLAVLVGMAFQRPQVGIVLVLLILLVQPFSFVLPRYELTNFLLPTYGIVNLFTKVPGIKSNTSEHDWNLWPDIFGLPIPPILLSLGLQLSVGIFLWRGAVRKTANPFQPLIRRGEAIAIFGILLLTQHGLMWGLWRGQFLKPTLTGPYYSGDMDALVPAVHCVTIFLATMILTSASPRPETIRLTALRHEIKTFSGIFFRSVVSLAFFLGAVATAVLCLQFAWGLAVSWKMYLISTGNLFSTFLIFALLIEYCRLRHRRRALSFLALWLFVLCLLPLILGLVFTNTDIAKWSLLAPGVVALSNWKDENIVYLAAIVAVHFIIALLFWTAWHREWRKLLVKASTVQN